MLQRNDLAAGAKETFEYDFLDRLISPSKSVTANSSGDANGDAMIDSLDIDYVQRVILGQSPSMPGCDANRDGQVNMADFMTIENLLLDYYTGYDTLGSITFMKGKNYSYETGKAHAVSKISSASGNTTYTYDANGNMNVGSARTWDVENRLTSVTINGTTTDFTYDGDGNRVKKTVNGVTNIYVNRYYEKNTANETATSYYYLGDKLIAAKNGGTLNYIQQDSLGSTSVVSDTSGNSTGSLRYFPFGDSRFSTGNIPTDEKFTGQRLDSTGLYYYGARYYDPNVGRFISADTIVPNPMNPQSLNRYSYCLNNPLKFNDPSGTTVNIADGGLQSWIEFCQNNPDAALAMGQSDQMFNWGTSNPDNNLAMAYFLAIWAEPSLPRNVFTGWMSQGGGGVTLFGSTPIASPFTFTQIALSLFSSHHTQILINPNEQKNDLLVLAALVGHELYHAREGHFADSIQEEVQAYRMQYSIGLKLNVDANKLSSLGHTFYPLGPSPIDEDLERARTELKNNGGGASNLYDVLPIRPASTPWGQWVTLYQMWQATR